MDSQTTKQVKEALDSAIRQKKINEQIVKEVGNIVIDVLEPTMKEMADNLQIPKKDILNALSNIKIDLPEIKVPNPIINIPPITVPKPEAIVNYTPPKIEVNVPPLDIKALAAKIELPNEMNVRGWVGFMGYDRGLLNDPLPVQIRDAKGNPVVMGNGGAVVGGGGGVAHQVKINNATGNPVPVTIVSGASATSGVNVLDSSGVAYSGSNPLPVTITAGATATTAVQNLNADGDYRDTFPVEGTVAVSGITASVAAAIVDSSGQQYSNVNPMTVKIGDGVDTIDILEEGADNYNNTMNQIPVTSFNYGFESGTWDRLTSTGGRLNIADGGGEITVDGTVAVSGVTGSVVAVGVLPSDTLDTGSAPIKTGGIARTANPDSVSGGDIVSSSYDSIGRQIIRPVQVRGLVATAYVAKATGSTFGTETTLLASGAGVYLDLIYVMGTNDSTAAIQVDLRPSTGGTVCKTIEIPAGGTAGVALPVPYPAPFSDHTWTIDLPDVTGTNVTISALFSKEV